jgi:hypothetical protein
MNRSPVPPNVPPYIDERLFTEFLAEEIRRGFGLVPFVGSGLSAPSGIVMGQDFMNYLTWVVYRSVATPEKEEQEQEQEQENEQKQKEPRLDLRKEGWPEIPNANQVELARRWVWERFKATCKACNVVAQLDVKGLVKSLDSKSSLIESSLRRPLVPKVLWSLAIEKEDNDLRSLLWSLKWKEVDRAYSAPPDVSITSVSYISECAIRTLHDWRCTLDFLARLHVGDENQGLRLSLEATDQTIIDSFNFFITHRRKPNLAHNMLCHLASRARIRSILTTNFDTLLEDAFSQLGEHFEVIQVGIHGELPAPGTVQAQNSIVKLHGALVDTRADLSLDERPTDRDLQSFFEYVRGKPPDRALARFLPGLLLVCGYSANDLRCVQMIKYLLDADREAKVWWVCHSRRDLENLNRIFNEQGYKFADEANDYADAQIVATVTDRTDLLLYELYQRLTLSLPRGGFNYQFSPNVPPQRHFTSDLKTENTDTGELNAGLTGKLQHKRHQTGPADGYASVLWKRLTGKAQDKVVVADGPTGLMEPMRVLFEYMTREERKRGIWLELEDYADTASVAHELFTIIALRLGRFQLDHARLVPPDLSDENRNTEIWKKHINELVEHWDIAPADWFVVFYGRNGPGGCAGWEQTYWRAGTKKSQYRHFEAFLAALCAPGLRGPGQGFRILYAPYAKARYDRDVAKQSYLENFTKKLRREQRTLGRAQKEQWAQSDKWESRINSNRSDISKRAFRYRVADETDIFIPPHDYKKNKTLFPRSKDDSSRSDYGAPEEKQFEENLEATCAKWLRAPEDEPDEKKGRINARRALYAATLFRQARHFSAFLSEGVYPCPCRFNTQAIDNDWLRNGDVREWLDQWSKLDGNDNGKNNEREIRSIFFRKPGGFAWAYRDSRLGIQRVIEGMGPLEFKLNERVARQWKSHASEVRARMHFWIGEWYNRAYRATGHADPLLEALYHFGECIHYCPIAMPLGRRLTDEDVRFYRLRIARRALLQLTKALRLGRRELRFWIQRAAGEPWFGKTTVDGVIDGFRNVFRDLEPSFKPNPSSYLEEWLSDLRWETLTLPQKSEDDKREIRFAENVGGFVLPPASRYPSPFLNAVSPDSPLEDNLWHGELSEKWKIDLKHVKEAPKRFTKLMEYLNVEGNSEEFPAVLDTNLKRWRDETVRAYDAQRLFILAQVTRELAYLFIMRAKRQHHRLRADKCLELQPDLARLWVQACGLCWLTLDLCDELPAALLASETNLRIVACTLYGLALGRLGRFYEGHRRLNEAHAWLSKSEGTIEPLDAALIKLRRAEVHIFEALRLRCILDQLSDEQEEREKTPKHECPTKDHGWKRILKPDQSTIDQLVLNQWEEMYFPNQCCADRKKQRSEDASNGAPIEDVFEKFLRIHVAKLDDAWFALDTAERVLSGKSHSALWWGHLHQLRLRVYATHWGPRNGWDGKKLPIAVAFRKRRNHFAAACKTYQAALVASRVDPYHAIRLADYGCQAVDQLSKLGRANHLDAKAFVEKTLSPHFRDTYTDELEDSLLASYREDVADRIKGFVGN